MPRFFYLINLIGSGLIYFVTQPSAHIEGEDTIYYILRVSQNEILYHPNHLLFEPMHGWIATIVTVASDSVSTAKLMQTITVFFAVAALGLTMALVARRTGGAGALAVALLLAATTGIWGYGATAETYIPPLAFALLGLWLWDKERYVPAAVALGAAVLLHQLYVFLVVLVALVTLLKAARRAEGLRHGMTIGLISGTLVIGSYLAVFLLTAPSESGMIVWVLGHAEDGLWTPFSASSPLKAVVGLATAIVSPNFLFALPGGPETLASLFPGKLIVEETFMADEAIGPVSLGITILGFCVLGVLLGPLLFRALRSPPPARAENRLDLLLIMAVGLYAGLTTIWEPINREFWIHVVVFLAIWLGRRSDWDATRPRTATIWMTAAGALAAINLLTSIGPAMHPRNDYWRVVNEALLAEAAPGDMVITECGYICEGYLLYYGGVEITRPSLNPTLAETRGVRLLLSSFALEPPPGLGHQTQTENRALFLNTLADRFGPLPSPPDAATQVIWEWTEAGWVRLEAGTS